MLETAIYVLANRSIGASGAVAQRTRWSCRTLLQFNGPTHPGCVAVVRSMALVRSGGWRWRSSADEGGPSDNPSVRAALGAPFTRTRCVGKLGGRVCDEKTSGFETGAPMVLA